MYVVIIIKTKQNKDAFRLIDFHGAVTFIVLSYVSEKDTDM